MNFKSIGIGSVILGVIGLVILLTVISSTAPTLDNSANLLSNTTGSDGNTFPFASLFQSGGLVMLAFMAFVLLAVMGVFGFARR